MLNNLTNFANIIKNKLVKKEVLPTDLIALGRADQAYNGGYQPIAITAEDLINQLAQNSDRLVAGTREVVLTDNMGDAILTFDPGSATIQTSGIGSELILSTLTGDDISLESGNDISLQGGGGLYDTQDAGGDISISGGKGAAGNLNDAGAGGDISISAGPGGNSVSGVDGMGGNITIQGGYTIGTGTSGGDVSIFAGGSTDGIYGTVVIQGAFIWNFNTNEATLEFPVEPLATLLSASSTPGARAMIKDSNVAASGNFGAIAATGGTNIVPVFSDGVNWLIG